MSGPELITLGCRLNAAESEAMRGLAAGQDDLVIVNSCAVTGEAVRQARKAIRAAAKRRPGARIVVTGCAAQIDPGMFAAMPEVSAVVGNREKREANFFTPPPPFVPSAVEGPVPSVAPDSGPSTSLGTNGTIEAEGAKIHVSDILAATDTAPHLAAGFGTRARAFVEVQTGCDHRCTFCIIPFARGPSRSVPAGGVIERIRALVADGYKEVVLTGVDTTSYGPDLPGHQTLGQLVERILTLVPELPRLRLSSLDSIEIDDHLFDLLTQEPRLQPHLHLSLQAGDDMVLKRMKRRHTRAQSVAMVARLKQARPEIAIGADLIAGFPTETDAMFEDTLAFVRDTGLPYLHVFPYSERPGTPAARMPAVAIQLRRERAARLREAGRVNAAQFHAGLVGRTVQILAESETHGHSEHFCPARFAALTAGAITSLRVTGADADGLLAA